MQEEFSIVETLYSSQKTSVYRATRKDDSTPLVLKVAESTIDISGLQNELKILGSYYEDSGVLDFVNFKDKPALVRKYIKGHSLRDILANGVYGEQLFKEIVFPIVAALSSLHRKEIIHKGISPGNIIVNLESGGAEIIDFEVGSLTQQVYNHQYFNTGLGTELFYISPEQTGRMNRLIDYRSDYYSLGMVFYEVLTGHKPFAIDDSLELIHAHIAQLPEDIGALNKSISKNLSLIIGKLYAKQADERYQSLAGLLEDLQLYLQGDLEQKQDFKPGLYDPPFRLKVSQQTVGREKEMETLYHLLDQVVQGDSCFLEISGYSGVGKTTLAKESLRKITPYRGLYISGKFEKVQGSTPYYGWISAFNELASVLQSESLERQQIFRLSFQNLVGELGGVITSLCPKLELFYGIQKDLPELSAKEMQNRFFITLNLFFKSLCSNGFPLVVFIDDWQWADDDSINYLDNLISDKTFKNFLLVTALRDNEVGLNHPYRQCVEALKSDAKNELAFLNLSPLSVQDCHELLTATLKKTTKPIDELVEVAFEKTQGNPFFLNSLFESIYDRKLLFVEVKSQQWDWRIDEISALHVSDDLAGMIVDKLLQLNTSCFDMLQQASFFGNRFSLKLLAHLHNENMEQVHNTLWPAIQNCLILPSSDHYKFIPEYYAKENIDVEFYFVHDKVQQACYNSYDSTQRPLLHTEIGKTLYNHGNQSGFDTATHFLNGLEVALQETDPNQLYEVFINAGQRAYMQSAMERSYEYYTVANKIFPIKELEHLTPWIECSFLGAGKEAAMALGQKALVLYEGQNDKFVVYETLIKSLESISENKTATQVSRKALAELGFKLPKKASKLQIIVKAIQAKATLNDKKIKQLTDFPEVSDPQKLALLRILNVSLGPFFLSEEENYPLIIIKMVMLGCKYGNCPEITAGYSSFALTLSGIMGAWESGYLLGVESLKLVEKYETYKNIAVCGFAFTGFVQHRKEPVKELPANFMDYYKKGIQYGEIIYANWNINFAYLHKIMLGTPMLDLRSAFQDIVVFNRQYKNSFDDRDLVSLEFLKSISDDGDSEFAQFENRISVWEEKNNPTLNFVWHMLMGIQQWLFGNFEKSFQYFSKCLALEDKMVGSFFAQYYLPFVAILSLYHSESDKKTGVTKLFKACRKKLLKQQKYYDYNVNWMLSWMEAEEYQAREGKSNRALFEKAELAAKEAGFELPVVLILIHRLGRTTETPESFSSIATKLIHRLRNLEMEPVVRFYEDKYNAYLRKTEKQSKAEDHTLKAQNLDPVANIDLMTLVRATNALTGELNLNKLLKNMLSYVMQNTGAQFGCFLVARNNDFHPELALTIEKDNQPLDANAQGKISEMVVNQVLHTKEHLILDRANEEIPYSSESTILNNNIKSLFCLPLLNQGKVIGIMYLTNSLIHSVFNEKRIALTKMLAGQIAVSVENALLYENMEQLVESRTEQLEIEKKKSDQLLLNILPEEVASELKEKGKATARRFELVSVLFTDFENFTSHTDNLSPEELVNEIDKCYSAFDEIMTKNGIEKIKTIGDSYMAACGLPEYESEHATKIVKAAIEIRDFIDLYHQSGGIFNIRIGIHSGPVIAGIVGSKKFAYDIWGDTVNVAARMEQLGTAGKVNISQSTYDAVKNHFSCTFAGTLELKNKGQVNSYFVEFRQPNHA